MKHIAQYETLSALQDAINNELETPWIASVVENSTVQYSVSHEDNQPNYVAQYFTSIAKEDGTIFTFTSNYNYTLNYSTDGVSWTNMESGESPEFSAGTKVYWKQSCEDKGVNSTYGIGTFNANNLFDVEGNVLSLLFDDNFENIIEMPLDDWGSSVAGFNNLLGGNMISESNKCENAENLILNATGDNLYHDMFANNTNLLTAPTITKFDLKNWIYYMTFYNCTNLGKLKFLVDIRDYIYWDTSTNQYKFTNEFGNSIDEMLTGCSLELVLGTKDGNPYYQDDENRNNNINWIIENAVSPNNKGFRASSVTVTFEKI